MSLDGALKTMIDALPVRAATRALVRRADSWVNVVTGLGSSLVDKVRHTQPLPHWALPDDVLSDLFHSDATVRKIVTKRADDALRLGVRVHIPENGGGHETATGIQDALDDLGVVGKVRECCYWETLYGGCALFIAVDDGQYAIDSQALPINEAGLREVLWLKPIDRTRIRASYELDDQDDDERSPTYGEPLVYLIDMGLTGVQLRVHRSRLILFPGAVSTDYARRQRQGWGISAIDPVYEVLQRNATAWASAGNALANAQYVIYKLKGLSHMFSRNNGEETAKSRARAMEMAKSMINAVLIDSEDDYVRENPNFGNMPEMLNQFMLDVSSAVDMPATVLWGRSPAGENATGESDLQLWHSSIDAFREHHLRPRLQRLIEILMLSKSGPTAGKMIEGWRVHFPALRQLSDLEKADLRLKTSQADASDITQGILMPVEVALSRYRPEGYSAETQVNLELRQKLLDLEIEQRRRALEAPLPGEIEAQTADNDNGDPADEADPENDAA